MCAFYVFNVVIICSYIVPRLAVLWGSNAITSSGSRPDVSHQELQAAGLLSLTLTFQFVRRRCLEEFLFKAFMYCKALQLWLLYLMDARLAACYAGAHIVLYCLVRPPPYDGPRAYDRPFTPSGFEGEVLADRGRPWLVLFGAPWSTESLVVAPLFAALSLEFGGAGGAVSFGEVDVDAWPRLAAQYKISDRMWSGQIPTIIMFKHGKEIARIPSIPGKDQIKSKFMLRKKDIVKAFGLSETSASNKKQ